MTYDTQPIIAWFCGTATFVILAAFAIAGIRSWWRERSARLQILLDPTTCVECGEPWHYPCPYGRWKWER
jgi:hypothetical protein